MSSPRIVLLGPQFHRPTAGDTLRELGLTSPAATITAGWQEREGEDEALVRQLPGTPVPLRLYQRAQRIWEADRELHAAHQGMQADLRTVRELYAVQLEAAAVAWVSLLDTEGPERLLGPERDAALQAIQRLDTHMLERVGSIRAEFEANMRLAERPSVREERAAIAKDLDRVSTVVIEGGHIAVLLNRIALFGVGELIADKTLVGCAGGAMALCRRVVLFDDSPAIGRGHAEVPIPGLGVAPGVIALPDATARLRTGEPERMRRLSLRLAPDRCALLDQGSKLVWDGHAWAGDETGLVLADGTIRPWETAA